MRGLAAALYLGLAAAYHPPAPCDTLEREKAWVAGSAGAEVSSLRVDGAWLQPVDKGAAPPRCTLSVAMGAAHGEEIARIPSSTLLHTANIHFTRLGASLRHHAAFQPFSPDVSGTNVQVASGDAEGCGEEAALAEEERVAVANPWPWTAAGSAAALVQNDHALLLALHILHEDGATDPPSPWAPLLASLPRACVLLMCASDELLAELRDRPLQTHAKRERAEALALRAHLIRWLRAAAPSGTDLSRTAFLRAVALARQRAVPMGPDDSGPLAIVPLIHAARHAPSAGPTPASAFDAVASAFVVRSETAAPGGAELVLSRGRLSDKSVLDRFGALPLRQNPMETVIIEAAALRVGQGEPEAAEGSDAVAARAAVLAAHGVPRALRVPAVLPLSPQLVFAARLTALGRRPLQELAALPPCAFDEELGAEESGNGAHGPSLGQGRACQPLSHALEAAAMDRLARSALAHASPSGQPSLESDDRTLFALAAACSANTSGSVPAAEARFWRSRYEFVRYRASQRRPYAALAAAATRMAVGQARAAMAARSTRSPHSTETHSTASTRGQSTLSTEGASKWASHRAAAPPMPVLGRASQPPAAAAAAAFDAGPSSAQRPLSPPPPRQAPAQAGNGLSVLEAATDTVGAASWRRGALSLGESAADAARPSAADIAPLSDMVDRDAASLGRNGKGRGRRSLWAPSDLRRVVRDAVHTVVTDASGAIEHVASGDKREDERSAGERGSHDTLGSHPAYAGEAEEEAARVRQAVESAWGLASSSRLTQRAAVDTQSVVEAVAASLTPGQTEGGIEEGESDPAAEYARLHRMLSTEWQRFEEHIEHAVSDMAERFDVSELLRSYGKALGTSVPIVETPPRTEAPYDGDRMGRVEHVVNEAYADGSLAGYSIEDAERAAIEAVSAPQGEAKGDCGESTYGEVAPDGLAFLLHHANASSGDVFLDIGSGVGRAVLQAALQFPLLASVGIELSSSRHADACAALQTVAQRVRAGEDGAAGSGAAVTRVSLLRTDAMRSQLALPLLPAAPRIVFANSVCFRPSLMDRLEVVLLASLPVGAVVFSAKGFPSEAEMTTHHEAVLRRAAEETAGSDTADPVGAMARAQAVLDGGSVGDADRDGRMAQLRCRYVRLGKMLVQEAVVFLPMGWTVGQGMPVFQYRVQEAGGSGLGADAEAACGEDVAMGAADEALPSEDRCEQALPTL